MYFISGVNVYKETGVSKYIDYTSRCRGYYAQLTDALEVVRNYGVDINGTINNYAVIEQIEMGINQKSRTEIWFKWDPLEKRYEPADKPEIKNPNNFALG